MLCLSSAFGQSWCCTRVLQSSHLNNCSQRVSEVSPPNSLLSWIKVKACASHRCRIHKDTPLALYTIFRCSSTSARSRSHRLYQCDENSDVWGLQMWNYFTSLRTDKQAVIKHKMPLTSCFKHHTWVLLPARISFMPSLHICSLLVTTSQDFTYAERLPDSPCLIIWSNFLES